MSISHGIMNLVPLICSICWVNLEFVDESITCLVENLKVCEITVDMEEQQEQQQQQQQEQQQQDDNKPKNVFEVMGQAVEISSDDLEKAVARQVVTDEKRQADALEDISASMNQIVRLLKPWAEREKRRNMLEQDPDYLEHVIKVIQRDRRANNNNIKTIKPKARKRK